MKKDIKYLGNLIGRTFLIGEFNTTRNWNGCERSDFGETDYDLLADFINYEEGGVSLFRKSDSLFILFFSTSSKVEVFKTRDGFAVFEGLFFNASLDNPEKISIEIREPSLAQIKLKGEDMTVLDSTIEGSLISSKLENSHPVSGNSFNSYVFLNTNVGDYSVNTAIASFEGYDYELKGVVFSSVPKIDPE